jgi:hypothetical protein
MGASLENGLLHVDFVREIPEAKKPRRIAIGNGNGSAKPKVVESQAAKSSLTGAGYRRVECSSGSSAEWSAPGIPWGALHVGELCSTRPMHRRARVTSQ